MNKTDRMELLMREMLKTYRDKNADYGDSFSKSYQEFGLTAPVVRMSDKMERLKSLSKAEARVKDESIRDTLVDLANYAMMTVIELDEEEAKIKECEDLITERLETRGQDAEALDKNGRPITLREVAPGLKTGLYRGYQIYIRHVRDFPTPRFPSGCYCGYVALPFTHPFYGEDYNDLDDIKVHGGLTFSGYLHHVAVDEYLLGFDCGHGGDDIKVQNEDYTLAECKKLVDQLIEAEV